MLATHNKVMLGDLPGQGPQACLALNVILFRHQQQETVIAALADDLQNVAVHLHQFNQLVADLLVQTTDLPGQHGRLVEGDGGHAAFRAPLAGAGQFAVLIRPERRWS